jgi:DHA1 family multidrug resistance protein-like MFS transporter
MAGAILLVVSVFWFSWTAEYNSIHWIVPTMGGVLLAAAILLIFVVFINYVVDSYEIYAASALAANTVLRSACAASSPLFTDDMFECCSYQYLLSSTNTVLHSGHAQNTQ